jgi:hypothetical protein
MNSTTVSAQRNLRQPFAKVEFVTHLLILAQKRTPLNVQKIPIVFRTFAVVMAFVVSRSVKTVVQKLTKVSLAKPESAVAWVLVFPRAVARLVLIVR